MGFIDDHIPDSRFRGQSLGKGDVEPAVRSARHHFFDREDTFFRQRFPIDDCECIPFRRREIIVAFVDDMYRPSFVGNFFKRRIKTVNIERVVPAVFKKAVRDDYFTRRFHQMNPVRRDGP